MSSTTALSSLQPGQSEMSTPGVAALEGGEEEPLSPASSLSPTRYSFAKNFLVSMVSKMG